MAAWATWAAWTSESGLPRIAYEGALRGALAARGAAAAGRTGGVEWRVRAPRSGQNRRIEELRICRLVQRKWADYRPVLPRATLRFLDRDPYLDVARADPRVREELVLGWFDDFEAQFHEPVLADVSTEVVTVCPPIMRERVEPEPPQIQRAYVEGAFLRRLFRFLVDGEGWELDAQVRDVMARHYSFQLAAVEVVDADRA